MDISRVNGTGQSQPQYTQKRVEAEGDQERDANKIAAGEGAQSAAQAQGTGAARPQAPPPARAEGAANDTVAQTATTTTSASDDGSEYQAILAKLNSGQALTSSELDTLKSKDPGRYAQAMQAQQARQQLRGAMEKNPAEAQTAARAAIMKASVAGDEGSSAEDNAVTRSALSDEYRKFSAQYDRVELDGPSASRLMAAAQDED